MSSRSAEIIDQIPSLRRYAMALVGDQAAADRMVEACLERLLADQTDRWPDGLRLAMFATFDLVHADAAVGADPIADDDAQIALRNALKRLPLVERKALLLAVAEGFAHAEVAVILRVSSAAVAQLVLAAHERLRGDLSLKVLVIEDQGILAMGIAQTIIQMGHQLCGIAHTRREALARARETEPDLILADVRLRDGDDGITTVLDIVKHRPVPVIFLTGHVHDLIKVPELHPTLVVGKPLVPLTIEAAVRRVLVHRLAGYAGAGFQPSPEAR
jgi:DNA-directed RNA polymerase specialized sigma24 family protein/CheY-like chemotaxis protein